MELEIVDPIRKPLYMTPYEEDDLEKHKTHDQSTHGKRGGSGARGSISASVSSGGAPGVTKMTYGEFEMEIVRDKSLGDPEYVDNALSEFGYWEGNYSSRQMSAGMMGLEKPEATGSENLNPEFLTALSTGKNPGEAKFNIERTNNLVEYNMENTANLMVGAVSSKPSTMPLFRGMTVSSDDPITSMKAGDQFDMPLSSFSYSRDLSEQFASPNDLFGRAPRTSVMFEMEPGAKGAAISDLGNSNTQINYRGNFITVPDEVVSQGKYVVTGVRSGTLSSRSGEPAALIVTISHKQVFNVKSGNYEPVK